MLNVITISLYVHPSICVKGGWGVAHFLFEDHQIEMVTLVAKYRSLQDFNKDEENSLQKTLEELQESLLRLEGSTRDRLEKIVRKLSVEIETDRAYFLSSAHKKCDRTCALVREITVAQMTGSSTSWRLAAETTRYIRKFVCPASCKTLFCIHEDT